MKAIKATVTAVLLCVQAGGQIDVGGFLKEKANAAKDKAIQKAREKTNEHFEKQRKEFDESNFNYAISFIDNSGTFEAEEKGNAFSNTAMNAEKMFQKEQKTTEDRAYTNLRNGELFMAGNKFWMAEKSFLLAKVLYEEDGKTGTTNYAQTISNLGLLYQSRGRYAKALDYNERALKMRQAGSNEGMKIVSMNNMAVLKKESGEYVEAEKLLNSALELSRKENDKLATALIFNNLAMCCVAMNRLKEAESNMKVSLNVAEGVLKEGSANFIKLQVNLACIYRTLQRYPEAEQVYLKAIAAKEKKLGAHPDLAHLKLGLAQLYMDMGRTEEVEKLLISAVEIDKKKLGDNNPATLAARQALGNYYRFSAQPEKAMPLLEDVVEKRKQQYGEDHPAYVQSQEDLALTQWLAGKSEAEAAYRSVIRHTLSYINTYFSTLAENEKTLYWERTNARLQRFFAFSLARGGSMTPDLYAAIAGSKGFLLNNSVRVRRAIMEGSDKELKDLYQQWADTRENINAGYQMSREEQANEHVNMDSLTRRANELERELSKRSSVFSSAAAQRQAELAAVQKKLKPGEAAVEVVDLRNYSNGFTGTRTYFAVVLTGSAATTVKIGDGEVIDRAIGAFREKVINVKPENEAFAVVWKPLEASLKGVSKIYVSLDGAYHQMSLPAMKDASGKYLVDKYQFQLCGSTASLLDAADAGGRNGTTMIVANPLYGSEGMVPQLPGAEKEGKAIAKLLQSQKQKVVAYYGKEATEAVVRQASSPEILHVATHGYFLADVSKVEAGKVLGVSLSAVAENPLLRSGLLFAGCENVFDEQYRPAAQGDNGVLTAWEAMNMNLEKTSLVVLSACETGLGSVKQGEGVYGLQRSFIVAGAQSVVMSLWSVSDEATMTLMTSFYNNYLKSGNRSQAFHDAIRALKVKYKEPFYWSAFVMMAG